jgi:hypothetical protein
MNKMPANILLIVISPKVAGASVFLFNYSPSIGLAFRRRMCAPAFIMVLIDFCLPQPRTPRSKLGTPQRETRTAARPNRLAAAENYEQGFFFVPAHSAL